MAHFAPAEDLVCLESSDAVTAGALGFMPRLLVLTTLPIAGLKVTSSSESTVGIPFE